MGHKDALMAGVGTQSCPVVSASWTGSSRDHRGFALVTVLWVITLLAVIAGSFTLGMRREAGIVHNLQQATEARLLAEAGVRYAMMMLLHPEEEFRWTGNGALRELQFEGVRLQIRVRDAAGYVDLNQAPGELLDGLLQAVGVENTRERQRIVDNILDWRDQSEHRRMHGDGAQGYLAAGLPYGPRNGPFPSVDELALVLGVTPELYRRMAPLLTVYGVGGVDPAVADAGVLLALPGVDEATLGTYLIDRDLAIEQGLPPPTLGADPSYLAQAGQMTYSVTSWVRLPGGQTSGLRVFMSRSRDAQFAPFVILSYRDLDGLPTAENDAG